MVSHPNIEPVEIASAFSRCPSSSFRVWNYRHSAYDSCGFWASKLQSSYLHNEHLDPEPFP